MYKHTHICIYAYLVDLISLAFWAVVFCSGYRRYDQWGILGKGPTESLCGSSQVHVSVE